MRTLVVLAASIVLVSISLFGQAFAQSIDAPGDSVIIPGTEIPGLGQVGEVPGRFGRPAGSLRKVPAVLILHSGGGVDGRGAFYATALQEAGIATLEITMFAPGDAPRGGPKANLPHAAAALKWLAAQPNINGQRLGVMGFSWGGILSLLMASELAQERMGNDVPKPVAFAPFYPCCSFTARMWMMPQNPMYNAHTRMSATPMLIHTGTRDDYEEGERACDAFIATWPAAARKHVTVDYVQGATHSFDSPVARQYYDMTAHAGRGGMVNTIPNPEAAKDARQAVVNFFAEHLKP
jgi:dienelactone hydrolase